jgi:phage shock protein C
MTDGSDRYRSDRQRGSIRPGAERAGERTGGELQQAVERFEQAVQELVGSATTEFSDRATTFLNETTAKLERELGGSSRRDDDLDRGSYQQSPEHQRNDAAARMAARRRARARARSERVMERSPRLERDDDNAKIVGVCAGIANYYGVEAWVVRCIAVTGLLFFGSIVFPAYWIMYFVMDGPSSAAKKAAKEGKQSRRKSRSPAREEEGDDMSARLSRHDAASPRRNLRNVQADLQEVELRLRRMETHVTSGQYELQRELHKIESDDSPGASPNPPASHSASA